MGSFDNDFVQLVVVKAHALNTVFCCIYRPPDTSLAEFNQALNEIRKMLSDLPSPSPTIVIGGDLNFPHSVVQWSVADELLIPNVMNHRGEGDGDGPKVRVQASKFLDLVAHFNMEQYVREVTHSKEILDLFFV